MDFERAPHFLLAAEARAMRFKEDKVIDAKRLDGTHIARIEVPAGHWIVIDEDGACEMDDAAFRALYVRVPGDERSFVRRGAPVRAVRENGRVAIEGRTETVPLADFERLAVRVDSDGSPLCRAGWPMWHQAKLLRASPNRGAAHLDDLRARRAELVAGVIPDPNVMADVHMLDGMLAAGAYELPDATATVLAMTPADCRDGGPAEMMSRGLGIDPRAILPVTATPTYREAAFRSMARRHLQPFLGGRPMEDAVCLALPNAMQGIEEIRGAIADWLEEGEVVALGAKVTPAEMPGYETSELRHVRFPEGLDVLSFEDVFGTYVYGWRSVAPTPDPDRGQPGMRLN